MRYINVTACLNKKLKRKTLVAILFPSYLKPKIAANQAAQANTPAVSCIRADTSPS